MKAIGDYEREICKEIIPQRCGPAEKTHHYLGFHRAKMLNLCIYS